MKTKILTTLAIATIFFACTKSNPNLVTITGEIINPLDKTVGFICKDTTYTATLKEDGTFEITFALDSSIYIDFDHGPEQTAMYVYPGDRIKLTINPEQFDETIKYEGSPTSSFLAKKYLLREESDFFGKEYYLGSQEEYKTFLQAYKTSLLNEFREIKDSSFIKKEISYIDKDIAYYINHQEELLKYGKDVRLFIMERREVGKKFNFDDAMYSLNIIEFDDLLKDYSDTVSILLAKVTDNDFAIKAREGIGNAVNSWRERKTLADNMPKDGEPAVDFTYPDKDGNKFSLSSFKGNLVYVDVWATWCGPCIEQIPALQKLEEEYHGKNITFLSVSVDENKDKWIKMLREKELGGIQLWAGKSYGADGFNGISKDYAIFGIPRFILVSADGNIISIDAPRPTSGEIRGLIDANL